MDPRGMPEGPRGAAPWDLEGRQTGGQTLRPTFSSLGGF